MGHSPDVGTAKRVGRWARPTEGASCVERSSSGKPMGTGLVAAMKRVAINGFGRIGRNFLRAYLERRPDYEIVAINDLGDAQKMAHLLEFDSLLGRLSEGVSADAEAITVGGRELQAFSIPEPKNLPWRELGIDVVVESTGRFTKRDQAQA